jgi:hypothetical protein
MANRLRALLKMSLWITGILILGASSLPAVIGHITEDPTKILQKYLSLDKKGVRLEAYSWQVVRPFVAWMEEPVWGHVVVISQFEVVENTAQWEIFNSLDAKIPVIFDVLGTMYWESATFVADPHREFQYFHVQAAQDRWQISGPQLPPHVGRQRMIDFVRWTELNESDPVKKALFASLKKQLESKIGEDSLK